MAPSEPIVKSVVSAEQSISERIHPEHTGSRVGLKLRKWVILLDVEQTSEGLVQLTGR